MNTTQSSLAAAAVVVFFKLKGQADLEFLDQGPERVVDANDAEEYAQEDDETIVGDGAPIQSGSLQFEVEIARPDEGEHGAREAADEAHQDGEVRDGNGHDDREDDESDAQGQAPDFQLAVERPHARESRFWPSFEEGSLQQIQCGVIRQRVRQQRLHCNTHTTGPV